MSLKLIGTDQAGSSLLSQQQNQQTTLSYSAYGSTEDKQPGCPGFNSERRDPQSGVSHLGKGYRAYSPVLMRFTCPDNLSPFGQGGINAYVYCGADPINHADPSGHVKLRKIVRNVVSRVRTVGGPTVVNSSMENVTQQSASVSTVSAQFNTFDATALPDETILQSNIFEPHAPTDLSQEASVAQSFQRQDASPNLPGRSVRSPNDPLPMRPQGERLADQATQLPGQAENVVPVSTEFDFLNQATTCVSSPIASTSFQREPNRLRGILKESTAYDALDRVTTVPPCPQPPRVCLREFNMSQSMLAAVNKAERLDQELRETEFAPTVSSKHTFISNPSERNIR